MFLLSKVLFSRMPSFACSPAMAAGDKFAWPKRLPAWTGLEVKSCSCVADKTKDLPGACEVLKRYLGLTRNPKWRDQGTCKIFKQPSFTIPLCSFHSKLPGCFFLGRLEPQNHTLLSHVFWYWYFPMSQQPNVSSSWLEKVNGWIYHEFLMVPLQQDQQKSIKINKKIWCHLLGTDSPNGSLWESLFFPLFSCAPWKCCERGWQLIPVNQQRSKPSSN